MLKYCLEKWEKYKGELEKDIVCSIIKPYNNGWREEPGFETIEYNSKE